MAHSSTVFNNLCRDGCTFLNAPLFLVGLFDSTNMWYRNSSGIFTPGLGRAGTFCQALHEHIDTFPNTMFVVPNAAEDIRFASHPTVMHRPFTRFYAGVPLTSFNGHFLGTLAAVDFHERERPTKEEEAQLHHLATKVVGILQEDLISLCSSAETGETGENGEKIIVLPTLWVDVSVPEWRIVGANAQWELVTGVSIKELMKIPGVLSVMGPGDDTELQALNKAVATVDKNASDKISLPCIMSPYASNASSLQFVMALRPATDAPPLVASSNDSNAATQQNSSLENIWTLEIHARIQALPPPPVRPLSLESATSSYNLGSSSTYTGDVNFTPAAEFNSDPLRTSTSSGGSGTAGGAKTATSSDNPRIPPRLGSLQLGPLLGRGSFGSVYSGILRGRPVAVKILEAYAGPKAEVQLQEAHFEALVGLQKSHENVVQTMDFLKEDAPGQVWIVQELCNMGQLSAQLDSEVFRHADNTPRIRPIVQTALDVASGMQYLHSVDVLHADLSSNNVLLSGAHNDRGFMGKVTDFGLSRISKKEFATKTLGTVSHMPPELLVDGIMTKAGDVFSFGVMLYEIYTGKHAWHGSSLGQVIFAVTVKGTKLLLPEDAPQDLAALVDECQHAERNDRPTFDEIVPRLQKILESLPEESLPEESLPEESLAPLEPIEKAEPVVQVKEE